MYNKKYCVEEIEEFNEHNPIYDYIKGSVCYLAYLNIGERGWFLYEENDWVVHRIHTSTIKDIKYFDNRVIVVTLNTKFVFRLIEGIKAEY